MPKGCGALPYQRMKEMISANQILGASEENLQPASLDLTISEEVYRIQSVFLPYPDEKIRDAMKLVSPELHNFHYPLEVGVTYLVKLNESLKLPKEVYAFANPKSSTGRIDLHVRMIADGIRQYDSARQRGYSGSLWLFMTPRSFRVKLNPGDSLIQMRFFNDDTRVTDKSELETLYRMHDFLFNPEGESVDYSEALVMDNDGRMILTVNLDLDFVGYRCEQNQKVLDFTRRDYMSEEFFQPIQRPKNGHIVLRKGDFYILTTKEYLRVPPNLAVEMEAIATRNGDFRAQYAGYFDPGWGFGRLGKAKGAPAVLEVRSLEDTLIVRDGQPICKMVYERMTDVPDVVYGDAGSHYFDQKGPRLSKHFRRS